MKRILNCTLLGMLLCTLPGTSAAQSITEIVTDFNGYWLSGRPVVNTISPNNSHNLVAFTWNGTRYSTGIKDTMLTNRGMAFTPGSYKALPVGNLPAAPATSTYTGLGQLYDGVANGPAVPPPANNIPFYLTDGLNGLNLGTAVYNLPVGNLVFDVGTFNNARINDGIPDIIVTQVGEISGAAVDTFKFTDAMGATVGIAIPVTFAGADSLGIIDNDFYNAWQSPMGFATGFYPNNTKRAVRMYAFELSDFGLTSTNFGSIDKFVQHLSGQSDQAFVAYNTTAITINPDNNPGCLADFPGIWLKANAGTSTITTATKLSQWQDRSPNTFSLEQTAAALQPQYRDGTDAAAFNFNPYLNFDAANKLNSINNPFTAATDNADFFIAGRATNTSAGLNKILGFSRSGADNLGTGTGDFVALNYDATGRVSVDSGTANLVTGTHAGLNSIFLEQINYTQGAGANISLYRNGSADGSVSFSRQLGTWTFQLGDLAPGDNFSDFDLAEIIAFPKNLLPSERIAVETYLNIKYGITSSHDFVAGAGTTLWSIASNTGYNNSIFGIGREDCQNLHQRQSKSRTADGLVTIGNIGIAVDNNSNFNYMNNGTFELMGDNNASLSLQTTEVPYPCYQRIGREWKVTETGTVGNILLRVPAATAAAAPKLPAAVNNKMYMLVDNDGDFSSGIIAIIPMTLSGTNWEAVYNFANGNYYTFATDNGTNTDFNDLPAPWPAASAVINGCNTNADAVYNRADANGSRVMAWAGDGVTSEVAAVTNAGATADAYDDGLTVPFLTGGGFARQVSVRLNSNINSTPVYYRLWIDWNNDGNFGNDADGSGNNATYAGKDVVASSAGKTVSFPVTSPVGFSSGTVAMRLMVSTDTIIDSYRSNANFIYALQNGEVEDYLYVNFLVPVKLSSFTAEAQPCKAILRWTTTEEINTTGFLIERSPDGIHFSQAGKVPAQNSSTGAAYSFTDDKAPGGTNYYRLRITDRDGSSQYSDIAAVRIACSNKTMSLYPNPATDAVWIKNTTAGNIIRITDAQGRLLLVQKATGNTEKIITENFAAGVYFLAVYNGSDVVYREKVIKNN